MISARELRFRYSAGKDIRRLIMSAYIPVNTGSMLPEFLEGNCPEPPYFIIRPETPQLACRCFHPDCRRDHEYQS